MFQFEPPINRLPDGMVPDVLYDASDEVVTLRYPGLDLHFASPDFNDFLEALLRAHLRIEEKHQGLISGYSPTEAVNDSY